MTIYDYAYERKFPKVFVIGIDEDGDEILGIRKSATLKDLFEAYSDLVHYIDGEVIVALENLIKKKLSGDI